MHPVYCIQPPVASKVINFGCICILPECCTSLHVVAPHLHVTKAVAYAWTSAIWLRVEYFVSWIVEIPFADQIILTSFIFLDFDESSICTPQISRRHVRILEHVNWAFKSDSSIWKVPASWNYYQILQHIITLEKTVLELTGSQLGMWCKWEWHCTKVHLQGGDCVGGR